MIIKQSQQKFHINSSNASFAEFQEVLHMSESVAGTDKQHIIFYINANLIHEGIGLTHGILLSPAPSSLLVLGPIRLVHMSDLRHQWVIRVRIR